MMETEYRCWKMIDKMDSILRPWQRLMCLNGSNVTGKIFSGILEGTHLSCVNKSLYYPNTNHKRSVLWWSFSQGLQALHAVFCDKIRSKDEFIN